MNEHDHQHISCSPNSVEPGTNKCVASTRKGKSFPLRDDWQSWCQGRWPNRAMKLFKLVIFTHHCTFCAADINCRIDILGIVYIIGSFCANFLEGRKNF